LTLLPDGRSFYYVDGRSVRQMHLSGLRDREIYTIAEGYEGDGFSVADDGQYAFVVEKGNGKYRLQAVAIARRTTETIVESPEPIRAPLPRPRRAGVLYRRGDTELWLVNYDGQQNRRLRTAPGGLGPAMWAASGRTVLYLNYAEDRRNYHTLRELTPDTNADQFVAPTTQFVDFGRNSDASVFVGASSSKAAPHILLLLRVTRREFTLCEHRSTDPLSVVPFFSNSSERIYFQSDMHGKPAIYSMAIDKIVEKTES
jgi:oligogalacturonide lyase